MGLRLRHICELFVGWVSVGRVKDKERQTDQRREIVDGEG